MVVRFRIDLPTDGLIIFPGGSAGATGGLPLGRDHLSDLHDLFEVVQILMDLLPRFTPEKLRHPSTENARGRAVLQVDFDIGTASGRSGLESNGAVILDLRSFKRTPGDQPILLLVRNFRILLDALACRASDAPVRAVIAQCLNRVDIAHKFGQILKITPEFVNRIR